MSTIPTGQAIVQPQRVVELLTDMGTGSGHRLVLLSLEVYPDWADLRFARIETPGAAPLPRRIPRPEAWDIRVDGTPAEIVDAVGRGDRAFSNGEVRLRPAPRPGAHIEVSVRLAPGTDHLSAAIVVPSGAPAKETRT